MSDLPAAADPRLDALHEAYRRGILPADRKSAYEEALRRGILAKPGAQPSGVLQAGGALAPDAAPAPDTEIGIGLETPGPSPAMPQAAPASVAGSARGAADLAVSRSRDLGGEMRLLQGYDPSVDYDTGTGWTDAVAMHRSDNPKEKRAYLSRKYGPENVFTDRGGRFVVRDQSGKLISPEGTGFVNNLLTGTAAIYADAPMLAGGVGGAIAGAPTGPGGAIAGAVGGTAAGKAAIEAAKGLSGDFDKTLPETAEAIGMSGLYGGIGEGAGRLVTGLPGVAGRAFRRFASRPTRESQDLTASVLRAGGVPPIRSAAPGLGPLAIGQDLAARLGYDPLEVVNRRAVHGRLSDIIDSAGMAPAQRDAAIEELLNPTARVSAQESGQSVLQGVRLHGAQLEGEVDNLARDADRILTGQLNRLNAIPRRAPTGDLGMDVATGISQARQDFSRSMQNIYAQVDRAVAPAQRPGPQAFGPNLDATDAALFGVESPNVGAPIQEFPGIVPTGAIKREARRILQALPKDAEGNAIFGDARVLRSISQLRDLGPKITLSDAQRIRSTLGDFGEFTDLTPGIAKRQFDDLRTSVNTAIRMAAEDPAAAPAVNLLRRADQTYSEGVRRFEDATINQLVSQARTGMMPDPGAIAEKVLQPRFTARAREIRGMVGPDVWRRVASADFENVMAQAVDPQTGEMSARKLATLIRAKDRNGLLELTYGPGLARDMRLYSQRLDARGGKLPAEALTLDNFGQTMRQLEAASRERDRFLSRDFLSELSNPKAMPDDAINFVARPGQETRLVQAQAFFGNDSPQMNAIREQAKRELLNSAIVVTGTGTTTSIAGDGIETALTRWTPRQQEILFPDGLADDMRRLAREIRFMYPKNPNAMAGGMAAGAIGLLPFPTNIPAEAPFKAWSYFLSKPGVVRALSGGLRPGPGKAATRETIRMIFREAALGELPHPDEEPEPGVISKSEAALAAMNRKVPPPRPVSRLRGRPQPPRELRPSTGG